MDAEKRCCKYCKAAFDKDEQYVSIDDQFFHVKCFNCAQCFNPLLEGTYFNVDGKFYCEYDFKRNYAPVCQKCKNYVLGKVIRTVRGNYHSQCLKCDDCDKQIEGSLFFEMTKNQCGDCHQKHEKPDICAKCKLVVLPEERLLYRQDIWHAEHFECMKCARVLSSNAQQWHDKLYCKRCYDRYIMVACTRCHRVIDYKVERAIEANGKFYHVNHFLCENCFHPLNDGHHLFNGMLLCKPCYLKAFCEACRICQKPTTITVFNVPFCEKCLNCAHCHKNLMKKPKVVNLDNQPICNKCFERLPKELKKRIQP